MLIGIDPRLNAEVLHVLRAMGHGDMLIISDMNFPSASIAKETAHGSLLRMENIPAPDAIRSILSVLPLDEFVADYAGRMEVVGDAGALPPVQAEAIEAIRDRDSARREPVPIERFAFYELAKQSYAVIQTGERRFYGCFMLRKGVLPPDPGT